MADTASDHRDAIVKIRAAKARAYYVTNREKITKAKRIYRAANSKKIAV